MESPKLVIFMLVFSLLFPPLSFAFTNIMENEPDFVLEGVDPNNLIAVGLIFDYGESHNITLSGGWIEYELNGTKFRVQWVDSDENYFEFEAQTSPIDKFLNTWWFTSKVIIALPNGQIVDKFGEIENAEIISYYEADYYWTHFKCISVDFFFTPDNTTISIEDQLNSGNILLSIARVVDENNQLYNFGKFANWYFSIITGSNNFGLPSFFTWIIRIISAIQLVCAVWVTKDLLRV